MSFVKSDEEHKNSSEIENYKKKETDVNISNSLDNSDLKTDYLTLNCFHPFVAIKRTQIFRVKNKV
jgi:hypothetical protein